MEEREYFTVSVPRISISLTYLHYLIALILSTLLVVSVATKFNIMTIVVILIATGIFIVIMDNTTGMNLESALPSTTYPIPPHLGLDGINLQNRYNRISV